MRVGKKNKKHKGRLVCRITRCPVVIWSVCFGLPVKMVCLCFMFKLWSVSRLWNGRPTIGYNVLRLGEGGDFTTNVHTKHTLQIYEKLSYEALNRHFCQTAVISCPSVRPRYCRLGFAGSVCCERVRLLALSFTFAALACVGWQKQM